MEHLKRKERMNRYNKSYQTKPADHPVKTWLGIAVIFGLMCWFTYLVMTWR